MKRLFAVSCGKGGRKALLAVFAVSVFSSTATVNAETITKAVKPDIITVLSVGGFGLAQFNLLSTDFPRGTLATQWKLQGIDWMTTSYLKSFGEEVELCFYLPFSSVTPVGCKPIRPNSSGTVNDFNDQRFGNGSKIIIRHTIMGASERLSYPAGNDSVTIRFSE